MRVYKFVAERHMEYGEVGWRLANQPRYDPLSGMAVAHDVLEHFPNSTEDVHDELMAFGAMMLVRGDSGYWAQRGRIYDRFADNASVDFPTFLRKMIDCEAFLHAPDKAYRLAEEDKEEWIADTIQKARQLLLEEERDSGQLEGRVHRDRLLRFAPDWMRKGYRKALRRYSGVPSYELGHMFTTIEKEADLLLKHAEPGYSTLNVRVDLSKRSVDVTFQEYGGREGEYL